MTEPTDWMSHQSAPTLAKRIRNYWRKKGYEVEVWVDNGDYGPDRRSTFSIRSNLISGFPMGYKGKINGVK